MTLASVALVLGLALGQHDPAPAVPAPAPHGASATVEHAAPAPQGAVDAHAVDAHAAPAAHGEALRTGRPPGTAGATRFPRR